MYSSRYTTVLQTFTGKRLLFNTLSTCQNISQTEIELFHKVESAAVWIFVSVEKIGKTVVANVTLFTYLLLRK